MKMIIDENKNVSLDLGHTEEISPLLKDLVRVLKVSFPHVIISTEYGHCRIAGIGSTGIFATLKSFLEELYIRYLDGDDDDFDKTFFFL